MKIIHDEIDKKYIDRVNTALENDPTQLVSYIQEKGRKYYLEIECTDPGKASAFIMTLMNHASPDRVEFEESLGFKLKSINYSVIPNV